MLENNNNLSDISILYLNLCEILEIEPNLTLVDNFNNYSKSIIKDYDKLLDVLTFYVDLSYVVVFSGNVFNYFDVYRKNASVFVVVDQENKCESEYDLTILYDSFDATDNMVSALKDYIINRGLKPKHNFKNVLCTLFLTAIKNSIVPAIEVFKYKDYTIMENKYFNMLIKATDFVVEEKENDNF